MPADPHIWSWLGRFLPERGLVALYRATFKPSAQLQQPYVMLGFNVFAADTDEEAQLRALMGTVRLQGNGSGRVTAAPRGTTVTAWG